MDRLLFSLLSFLESKVTALMCHLWARCLFSLESYPSPKKPTESKLWILRTRSFLIPEVRKSLYQGLLAWSPVGGLRKIWYSHRYTQNCIYGCMLAFFLGERARKLHETFKVVYDTPKIKDPWNKEFLQLTPLIFICECGSKSPAPLVQPSEDRFAEGITTFYLLFENKKRERFSCCKKQHGVV